MKVYKRENDYPHGFKKLCIAEEGEIFLEIRGVFFKIEDCEAGGLRINKSESPNRDLYMRLYPVSGNEIVVS